MIWLLLSVWIAASLGGWFARGYVDLDRRVTADQVAWALMLMYSNHPFARDAARTALDNWQRATGQATVFYEAERFSKATHAAKVPPSLGA